MNNRQLLGKALDRAFVYLVSEFKKDGYTKKQVNNAINKLVDIVDHSPHKVKSKIFKNILEIDEVSHG